MDTLKNRLLFGNMLGLFVLAYALLAGPGLAAPGAAPSFAPVSNTFAYEGRIGNNSGKYDFKFRLFDAATNGNLVTSTVRTVDDVLVDSGEYVVALNFGPTAFTGEARYLEVRYRVHSEDPSDPYTTQGSRQPILAVPYALSLRAGATVEGPLDANTAAITGSTSSPGAYGLKGFSQQSAGVFGQSTSRWGVFGRSSSGQGVYGETYAENTSTVAGVYGKALQQGGIGVIGDAQLGAAWGVYGTVKGGVGVRGAATSGIGVSGSSASGSAGVYGQASGATASGVEGSANASGAAGVYGKNPTGRGVWGHSDSGTAGVYGRANGAGASGVEGYANGSVASAGVYGHSSNGVGVWGRNEAGGYAMKAEGHATQSLETGGWVKAMAYINPAMPAGQQVVRCYNSQLPAAQATTGNCGITLTSNIVGVWYLNFGFPVTNRFISVTSNGPTTVGAVAGVFDASHIRVMLFYTYSDGNRWTNAPFFIIVY